MAKETDQDQQYFVSVSFQMLSRHRRKLGNAIYLFLGLSDLTTKEFACSRGRCGAVLGFSVLTDQQLADRFGAGFTARTIRRWRQKLRQLGLILQHNVPGGYQLALVGSNRGMLDETFSLPKWLQLAVPAQTADDAGKVTTSGQAGGQKWPGGRSEVATPYRQYRDNTKQLRFRRECLEVSWPEHAILKKKWPDLDLDAVYEEIAEIQAGRGQPVRSALAFVDTWLQRVYGDPSTRTGNMPEASVNPELLALLRKKEGYGVNESPT